MRQDIRMYYFTVYHIVTLELNRINVEFTNIWYFEVFACWDVVPCCWVVGALCFKTNTLSQDVCNLSPGNTALHPRRAQTSTAPRWKCYNFHLEF
jgi:hypothetical protein